MLRKLVSLKQVNKIKTLRWKKMNKLFTSLSLNIHLLLLSFYCLSSMLLFSDVCLFHCSSSLHFVFSVELHLLHWISSSLSFFSTLFLYDFSLFFLLTNRPWRNWIPNDTIHIRFTHFKLGLELQNYSQKCIKLGFEPQNDWQNDMYRGWRIL